MRTHSGKKGGFNYLAGLTNLVVVSLVTWFFYHIFLHPEPILKTILIINGLTFEVVFLSIVIMIAYMIGFYPDSIQKLHPISRGVLLLLISILLVVVVYFIIFRNVIGRFGVAYFSPVSILASGGTGAEPLNALMQSSEAILYFHIGFIWMAFLWKLSAGDWPWNDCTHSVVAFSRSITILFVATITYTILFHPVICYLFYPPQNKAAVKPWWGNIASTGSVYFHLGWILCTLAWIIISIFLWEGYPWKLINKEKKGSMVRVGATSLGTLFLGIITMIISMKIMNLFWGEAFPGGQYTDGIDFRYIRAGEICSFFILTTCQRPS
jgi:amino acid transporter, AAT family